jgi:hypothetical protein
MVNAGVKGACEQSEDDKCAAPNGPAGPRGANQPGKRDNGRPQEEVTCEKSAVGRDHQRRMLREGRKLLGKEEMELDSKESAGEEKDGSQDHCDSANPTPREPEGLALSLSFSALRGSRLRMRFFLHD